MTRHAQEPVRPFPVVLRPRPDELLSSWLTRHATYYGVTRRRLLDHVGILSPSVEALDREITLGQQIMLAGYFHRQAFEIAAMSYETVRSNMRALIRPSAPQQSCQARAEKAERADAKGAIGKSWMQGWRITCRVCGARLTDEDDPQMAQASAERFSDYWDSSLDGESMFEIYASVATETGTSPLSIAALLCFPRRPAPGELSDGYRGRLSWAASSGEARNNLAPARSSCAAVPPRCHADGRLRRSALKSQVSCQFETGRP